MTTSNVPPHPGRRPLRLRLAEHPGQGQLDGGWWPRSRDLVVELRELVDDFPPSRGRISRVIFSPPDWDPAPRRIPVANGHVRAGSFPGVDTHVVDLKLSDRSVLRLLVVPPDLSADQGDEALLAAATSGHGHSAASILEAVSESEDTDSFDHWTDEGGAWWAPHPVAPSFREDR
jgi:hypothetical protein